MSLQAALYGRLDAGPKAIETRTVRPTGGKAHKATAERFTRCATILRVWGFYGYTEDDCND